MAELWLLLSQPQCHDFWHRINTSVIFTLPERAKAYENRGMGNEFWLWCVVDGLFGNSSHGTMMRHRARSREFSHESFAMCLTSSQVNEQEEREREELKYCIIWSWSAMGNSGWGICPEAKNQITLDANLNKYFTNQSTNVKGTPVFSFSCFPLRSSVNEMYYNVNAQTKMPALAGAYEKWVVATRTIYVSVASVRFPFRARICFANIPVLHLIFQPLDYSSHRQRAQVLFFLLTVSAHPAPQERIYSIRQLVLCTRKIE